VDHLVDDVTCSGMPDEVRRLTPIEFYRRIGCDIVQLGNYGLAQELRVRRRATGLSRGEA